MKAQKSDVIRIITAGILFVVGFFVPAQGGIRAFTFGLSVLISGTDVVLKALKDLFSGRMLDEHFLMSAAVVGAFVLGEYSEGAAVMVFYQTGELFQSYAVRRSRRSIAALMDIRPEYAYVKRGSDFVRVSPETVVVGDLIRVKAGDRIPLDGKVESGEGTLDTSALTGESVPRSVKEGDDVLSGSVNLTAPLEIRVATAYKDSTVAGILDLVEKAASRKARLEKFITRFARIYTPIVVAGAVLLLAVPTIFFGEPFDKWLYRSLTFLVVSCPCALVISVPLSFFGGLGAASKQGILIKGGSALEALSRSDIAVFDKTGTLTRGKFAVVDVFASDGDKAKVLETAAYADCASNHPVALSILSAYGKSVDASRVKHQQEIGGYGVCAEIDGRKVFAGTSSLMAREGISVPLGRTDEGTVVHVSCDGEWIGRIHISDDPKPDAAEAILRLKRLGVRRTVLLTGDNESAANAVARAVGIDEVFSGLLPAQKVERVEALDREKRTNGSLIFVGDGINDAPVLARSDVGIAMGGIGSDAAVEAADVVLMTDEPSKVSDGILISRRTMGIVRQNIVFALGIKLSVLVFGAVGIASMWAAVFADVGVTVIAVLNAMRALRFKRPKQAT